MSAAVAYRPVLAAYPAACEPQRVEFLDAAGGYSGARFWRLATARGTLCLRRWPAEHPTVERLEFIQAVLWHVQQEGFRLVPLPLETLRHAGYVRHAGHLWELTPWLPGRADYHGAPSTARLRAALAALAEFHLAAASFPLPDQGLATSPGIAERLKRLADWRAGDLARLAGAIGPGVKNAAMPVRAERLLELFPLVADRVAERLRAAATARVPLQPCIRDVWHDHILFDGERVCGLIDFGAMRADNVATDIARLLGSLAGDDSLAWQEGLSAYEALRPLSDAERPLVTAFDQSGVLLSGLNWLYWIYLERRTFPDYAVIQTRLDQNIARLSQLAAAGSPAL